MRDLIEAIVHEKHFTTRLLRIPAYNSEKYPAETIQSVLNQAYPHIEIALSDNNSKNWTIEIIWEFMAKHSNIKLALQPGNSGPVKNANAAIRLSMGEFFIILDHGNKPAAAPYRTHAEMVYLAGYSACALQHQAHRQ